uniref:Uncharacterized protein n=1 Tax=Arundo donax TaxID=35708 RepID=A0A0A9AYT5_ARUDO
MEKFLIFLSLALNRKILRRRTRTRTSQ